MLRIMADNILSLSTPTDIADGMKLIEELTRDADQVQEQVLQEILKRNAGTEYLKQFLHGQTNSELFKDKVPVVDYEDVSPYIQRIANGDRSQILIAQPIIELLKSSGTSGGQLKLIPTTAEEHERISLFTDLRLTALKMQVDGLEQGKRMFFLSALPDITTPGGFVVRNVVSSLIKNKKPKKAPFNWFDVTTSPEEVMLCTDMKQTTFLHLLCGLVQRDEVISLGAYFPTNLIRAIKFLEEFWEELCCNIRTGKISEWITDSNCRTAVSLILNRARPDLASAIEEECKVKSWKGIIRKLWPRTKIIEAIVTGSMAQYIPTLEFYCDELPLVSTLYGSSECHFGINLNPLSQPEDISYTLMPNMTYYEFLPIKKSNKEEIENVIITDTNYRSGGIVDLASVKIGQQYELLITTFAGLYRYRVGDILIVSGFYNKAPQFKFVRRQSVVLNIDVEKTTEEDLFIAVTNAMQILKPYGFILQDYTSCNEISSLPGHYLLFWELQTRGNANFDELDDAKMERCCASVEQSLDTMYKVLRKRENVIGPLEIRVVKHGTFDALMDFNLSQGSSASQYKTPRSIKSEKALQMLNSMVSGSYSSKTIPS